MYSVSCTSDSTPTRRRLDIDGEEGGGGRGGGRAARATVLHFVERLRQELGVRGYREEVVVDQREHVQEVVSVCFVRV
jgi:hypothetical protein